VEQVVEQSELITIAEAAKRLGITEDAVRKRIKKGTLQGRRENNKLMVVLESLQNNSKFSQAEDGLLLRTLQEEVALLCSQLSVKDQQLSAKDQQLAEKDQHLRQQLAVKDQQIEKLYEDIESWREQVRYKELQAAQLQDRIIHVSSLEEPEPPEQETEPQPAAARRRERQCLEPVLALGYREVIVRCHRNSRHALPRTGTQSLPRRRSSVPDTFFKPQTMLY